MFEKIVHYCDKNFCIIIVFGVLYINNISIASELSTELDNKQGNLVKKECDLRHQLPSHGNVSFRNKKIPIILVDGTFSESLVNDVLQDINNVFSSYTFSAKSIPLAPANKTYRIRKCKYVIKKRIDFSIYKGFKIPSALRKVSFGELIEINNDKYIVFSRELMALYKESIESKNKYGERIHALNDFVNFVNTVISKKEILSVSDVERLYAFEFVDNQIKYDLKNTLTQRLGSQNPFKGLKILKPSILAIYNHHQLSKLSELIAETLVIKQDGRKYLYEESLLIYVKGKWKIFLPT